MEQAPDAHSNPSHEPELNKFLRAAIKTSASDLHLKVGQPPKLRLRGELKNTTGEVMTKEKIEQLADEVLTAVQKQTLLQTGTVDFAHEVDADNRFRMNIFRQRGLLSVSARRVNSSIMAFDSLHLPKTLEKICDNNSGLVLVAGPTGSGKTTTIAAMIDYINRTTACHIVTIEDPIEYLFKDKKSIISQREIGIDVNNFDEALTYLMRQDPDVVFVGELRNTKTAEAAMRAAETGHLVFGTIHSANTTQTVQRLLELFKKDKRTLARQTLSQTIKAIISQMLLPSIKQDVGRVPALEILLTNPSVRKLIAEEREADLPTVIRSSREDGMQDFTDNLCILIKEGFVDPKEAYKYAPNADELKMALKGIRADTTSIM